MLCKRHSIHTCKVKNPFKLLKQNMENIVFNICKDLLIFIEISKEFMEFGLGSSRRYNCSDSLPVLARTS